MRPGQASRRRGRGWAFTIVEVLATLTLASIVLPPVTRGVLLCLATAAHARNHAQAASLAQSKMAELVATEQYHDAQMAGDFGEDLPDYTWTAEVNDWQDERLAQLDVSVAWTRRGREHQVVLSTLVYLGQSGE
jgi:type II secretory pathway pseudopilin PulG